MNKTIKFVVDEENSGKRIDIYLSKKIVELSRSYIKKLVEEGQVKINDITTSASSTKIKDRDKIIVKIIEKKSYVLTPKKIKLDIVFEDKDILIINKPKGMVVH
ncbi:S4 domain-containing protein, partial [Pelagibacteraceae bacterium]|nr:S4 domain-containing protein [Pelagibacteraceae bacterium]